MRRLCRYVVLALLGAYSLASIVAAASALWSPQGTLGLTAGYGTAIRAVDPGGPAARAGIAAGDHIHLDATPFAERRYLSGVAATVPTGTTVHFALTHAGATRDVVLIAAPRRLTGADRSSLVFECLASLLFVVVGAALILLRPSRATWGFGCYCLIVLPTANYPFEFASATLAFWIICAYDVVQNAGVVGLLVFALEFPRSVQTPLRRFVARSLPFVFVVLALMTVWPDVANLAFGRGARVENGLLQLAFGLVFGTAFCLLWDTQRRIARDERERVRWVLIGFAIGLLASYTGTTILFSSFVPFDPPAWLLNLLISLNVLLPLTVAHAVVRHRVFDINFVVSRALIYAIMTTGLAAVFGLFDWLFDHLLSDFRLSIVVDALISIGIAFTFDALHKRIEALVEALFFRKRRAAEVRLEHLAHNLLEARSTAVVERALVVEPSDALELTSAALFRPAPGGGLVRTASNGWRDTDCALLDDADLLVLALRGSDRCIRLAELPWRRTDLPGGTRTPAIALRLHARAQLGGIIVYGGHPAGGEIDPTEIELLDRLAHAAAIAFDELEAERLRAQTVTQAGRIEELEARLDELRRRSAPAPELRAPDTA